MNTDDNGCRQGVGTVDARNDVDLTKYDAVTEVIIGCALALCNRLGCGFLEKVYQRGLIHPMRAAGLEVQEKVPLRVMLDDVCLGEYEADIIVNGCILVELKAVDALASAHTAQCINYLRGNRSAGLPADQFRPAAFTMETNCLLREVST